MFQIFVDRNQLKLAETWYRVHAEDGALLLTLGRLAVRNELWGKATSYFEKAAEQGFEDEAFSELAKLHERLGDNDKALEYYRRSRGTEEVVLALPEAAESDNEPDEPAARVAPLS